MEENFLFNRFLPTAFGLYFDDLLGASFSPPPDSDIRITDNAEIRITDNGLIRVTD